MGFFDAIDRLGGRGLGLELDPNTRTTLSSDKLPFGGKRDKYAFRATEKGERVVAVSMVEKTLQGQAGTITRLTLDDLREMAEMLGFELAPSNSSE